MVSMDVLGFQGFHTCAWTQFWSLKHHLYESITTF